MAIGQVGDGYTPYYDPIARRSTPFRAASRAKGYERADRQAFRRQAGNSALDAQGVFDPMKRQALQAGLGDQAIQRDAKTVEDYRNGGMDVMGPNFGYSRRSRAGQGMAAMPSTMPMPGTPLATPPMPMAPAPAPTSLGDVRRGGGASPDPMQPILNLNTGANTYSDGADAPLNMPPAVPAPATTRRLNGITLAPDEMLDPITGLPRKRIGRRNPNASAQPYTTPMEDDLGQNLMTANRRLSAQAYR